MASASWRSRRRCRSSKRRITLLLLRLRPRRCFLRFRHFAPSATALERRHLVDLAVHLMLCQVFQTRTAFLGSSCERGRRTLCERTVILILFRMRIDLLNIYIIVTLCQRGRRTICERTVRGIGTEVVLCLSCLSRDDLSRLVRVFFTMRFRIREHTVIVFGVHDRHAEFFFRLVIRTSRNRIVDRRSIYATHRCLLLVEGERDVGHHLLICRHVFSHFRELRKFRHFRDLRKIHRLLHNRSSLLDLTTGRSRRSYFRHRDLIRFRRFVCS